MQALKKSFDKLGFPIDVNPNLDSISRTGDAYQVNVIRDRRGKEKFQIDLKSGANAIVLDTRPDERALVLMVKYEDKTDKMLLGHDERQLFIAAVPDQVTTVLQAKDRLKPVEVAQAERRAGVKRNRSHKHRNAARIRQGDFFFLPYADMKVSPDRIRKNEPINRGRGASHMVEELCRIGGETVMTCHHYPEGVTMGEYQRVIKENPHAKMWVWNQRTRNADVYARGRITHKEHATITLKVWHKVIPNTEASQRGFASMAFLD